MSFAPEEKSHFIFESESKLLDNCTGRTILEKLCHFAYIKSSPDRLSNTEAAVIAVSHFYKVYFRADATVHYPFHGA